MPRTPTEMQARSILSDYDALYVHRARIALPILVDHAVAGTHVTYDELAVHVGARARNMNYVLGSIGTTLVELSARRRLWIPPLQVLVVNERSGLPGVGFEGTGGLPPELMRGEGEERHLYVERLQAAVWTYRDWSTVLKDLDLEPGRRLAADFAERELQSNGSVGVTQKEQLAQARVGQGVFRTRVWRIERRCRVTGTAVLAHLRASHIKPWHVASNEERLDGYNGLLLAPHVDHLFDEGFMSFDDDGKVLVSSPAVRALARTWGIRLPKRVSRFHRRQLPYLRYHRDKVFRARGHT